MPSETLVLSNLLFSSGIKFQFVNIFIMIHRHLLAMPLCILTDFNLFVNLSESLS